jgi:murein DD-endopeptidase MepM/ murein hydrolase activator NlpD
MSTIRHSLGDRPGTSSFAAGFRRVARRITITLTLSLIVSVPASGPWGPAAAGRAAQDEGASCVGLRAPVSGHIIEPFAPIGRYEGHWGVDLSAPPGTSVRASAAGRVTFSGRVPGNSTITVDHGGGLRTSYSFLDVRTVGAGAQVDRGQHLGTSGSAHGVDAVHWSVRMGDTYRDPAQFIGCRASGPAGAVYLVLRT